jgi:hypothetical protein
VTLSEGRLSWLAHAIQKLLVDGKLIEIRNERLFLAEVKKALADELSFDERLDTLARARIPPKVPPGSREWDVQYRRFYEEERSKLER